MGSIVGRIVIGAPILSAAAGLCMPPALADVKAGVDAWSRGDYGAAVREWEEPAAEGDVLALFNLAEAYKFGRGVPQDLAKAEVLFRRAAAQGHVLAEENYGLLRFQRGDKRGALPYIQAAADRGNARAQYLLGISSFNGDIVPKDWVRAYALLMLARQAGLPQAKSAIAEMDQHISSDQRQQATELMPRMAAEAETARARQLTLADLTAGPPASGQRAATARPASVPLASQPATGARNADTPEAVPATPTVPAAQESTAAPKPEPTAPSVAATPAPSTVPVPEETVAAAMPQPIPPALPTMPEPAAATGGPWRVQLGAFKVSANADALWNKVKDRPEMAGRTRIDAGTGNVKRLLAGGFESDAAAKSACARLTAAGFSCLVTRN